MKNLKILLVLCLALDIYIVNIKTVARKNNLGNYTFKKLSKSKNCL